MGMGNQTNTNRLAHHHVGFLSFSFGAAGYSGVKGRDIRNVALGLGELVIISEI